ncbi:MAG TPA: TIGR04283 family arsenosugar biosynthesis glycosyltransferase [Candidatus Binatia bacterium]|jgi:rSAM/selenodomain-associated transferase 2/rSAM/selenodomain-associated transferase 1|nr:TIGR04283 family arsenosugar biosynthesis glycosyltransferase [Candidatus Binatia bacterium]
MLRVTSNTGRRERLILFTRYPVAGQAKTRLIPALGAAAAAALQRRLTLRAARLAELVQARRRLEFEIRFVGADEEALKHWLGDGRCFREQGQGDLGERMARAFAASFEEGSAATVLIGSDCPGLTPELLEEAFEKLSVSRVVLGPATDGGYYLVGLNQPLAELFCGPAWGTETVLSASLEILKRLKVDPSVLDALDDIDQPGDLASWHRLMAQEETDLGRVSVIIPTLNEAAHLPATLAALQEGKPNEILVADGGSSDETVPLASKAGTKVVASERGRARQMNAAAAKATGNTLLFIHADTIVPPDFTGCIAEALARPSVVAGAFRFQIKESFFGKQLVEGATNWRSRWRQMPYGDQGLFMARALFEEMGGFAPLPFLEDYELVRRLRRLGRVVTVEPSALTSGRRWQRLGALRTTLINRYVIAGYHLGWPLERLAEIYASANAKKRQESVREKQR